MDRLLSEQEMMSVCNNGCTTYDCKHSGCHARLTAQAQLAKTDKEWAEWGASECPHWAENKAMCVYCWQERKRSIGI